MTLSECSDPHTLTLSCPPSDQQLLLGSMPLNPSLPLLPGSMALALFGLASLPTAFERVCAAPPAAVDALVCKTLDLMAQPAARKNIVLFLGACLHHRRLLEAFDRQVCFAQQ